MAQNCNIKTKALIFGTFDKLHKGHIYFIRKAQEIAEQEAVSKGRSKDDAELFVVVARDVNVKKIKKKTPTDSEMTRLLNVYVLGIAKTAYLGDEKDFFKPILDINPDIICLGYDQDSRGAEEFIKKNKLKIEIKRIDAFEPETYKSSKL